MFTGHLYIFILWNDSHFYLFLKHFFTFIYFWLKETEHKRKCRERGRHRVQSRLQALSCQHRAQCGARTHRLQDHDLSRSRTLNRLSHPGAPRTQWIFIKSKYTSSTTFSLWMGNWWFKKCNFISASKINVKKNFFKGAPGWLSQLSVLTSAQVMISRSVSSSPASGSVLTAQSLEPVSDSVSLSLWPSPVHVLSLSVSKINKR